MIRQPKAPAPILALCSMALAALAATAVASTGPPPSTLAPIHGRYRPHIDPANFVATVDNRYLPFIPGTAFHYEGVKGRTRQTDDEVVTHRTKRILGVTATVVRDTVSEHGRPIERTFDYYAQDKQGDVWYMGELSLERHHGRLVKVSDSWLAGVDGGRPGIIMPPTRGAATSTARSTTRPARRSTRHAWSAIGAR